MASIRKTPTKMHVGVLLLGDIQYVDAGGVDLLAFASRASSEMLRLRPDLIEASIADFKIEWVTEESYFKTTPGANADARTLPTTAKACIAVDRVITAGASDAETPLYDVLFMPGPDPNQTPPEAVNRFIRKHHAAPGSDVLVVCSANSLAAHAGIFDGKTATATRPFIKMFLQERYPKIKWDDSVRWVKVEDGLWSSGGALSGLDMTQAYMREKFDKELVDAIVSISEVAERPVKYSDDGSFEFNLWNHERANELA